MIVTRFGSAIEGIMTTFPYASLLLLLLLLFQ
jgi:hypothetical protein